MLNFRDSFQKNEKNEKRNYLMKYIKKLFEINIINDIKDILIDISNETTINLEDKTIRVIDYLDNPVVWDVDSEHTFIMLGNYLKENLETDKIYFIREINGEISYREIMKYHEFLSIMNYGDEIINLLMTIK